MEASETQPQLFLSSSIGCEKKQVYSFLWFNAPE
jgi:hypothetical protein